MLTSKQRAALRSHANGIETIFQIGKNGVNEMLIAQLKDALKARELIKIRVLESAMLSPGETAELLAQRVNGEVVQVMGSRITLFKRNHEKPIYALKR